MTKRESPTDVRRDVIRYLSRRDAKRHNILLLGQSGSGKSALLNTMIKAICGDYLPKAPVGRGETQSKTLELIRYENCGLTQEDVRPYDNYKDKYDIRKLIPLLPHIFDAAGVGNVNSPESKEFLELLLEGYIPPGTNIKSLQSIQTNIGVGYLREKYRKGHEDRKISKIVFVQSGQNAVPEKLVECLLSIIRRNGCDTSDQYTDDVFIVVTKEDLAIASDNFQKLEDVDEDGIQTASYRERFEAVVAKLAKVFSIEGALQHNLQRWTSYGDDVGYDSDEIDLQALKLLRKLVMPGKPIQPPKKISNGILLALLAMIIIIIAILYAF